MSDAANPPSDDDRGDSAGGGPTRAAATGLSAQEIATHNEKARRGLLWIFSTTVLWQVVSWLCTLLTIRILHPEDYGLVALPDAVFPYLMMLTTLRLDTWLIQTQKWTTERQEATHTLVIILALISSVVGLVAAPLLARFYAVPELEAVAQAMCLTFLPRALRVLPESRLRRDLHFKPIALANLIVGIARGGLQVWMAWAGYGAWTLIWGAVFNELALLVWLGLVGGMPLRLRFDSGVFREAIAFGASVTGSTIFWVIFSSADNLVVGKLFGKEMLGYYATAFMLTELPLSKINTVLGPIMQPYYAKLIHNREELYRVFLRINRTLVSFIAPALVGLAVVAPALIPTLFGAQWAPMERPLQVMCIVGILRGLTANVSSLLYAIGEPHRVLRWSAVMALVLPASFFVLGSRLGMNGIYFAWLVVYPLLGPVMLFRTVSEACSIPVRTLYLNFLPTILCAGIMGAAVWGGTLFLPAGLSPYFLLPLQALAGGLVYTAVYAAFSPEELSDSFRLIRGMFRR